MQSKMKINVTNYLRCCKVMVLLTTLASFCSPTEGVPRANVSDNEVYPGHMQIIAKENNALRTFIKEHMEDERVCYSPLKEFLLGTDNMISIWWSKICESGRGGRYRPSSPQAPISDEDLKEIEKLMSNKLIKCNPKKIVLELKEEFPGQTFTPSCVSIKRCGGCCGSELLECVSDKNKTKTIKVFALKEKANGKYEGAINLVTAIKLKEHTKCKCQCKVREEHCTKHQTYNSDSCACTCKTLTRSCVRNKLWDPQECKCICKEKKECTTGREWDEITCSCGTAK